MLRVLWIETSLINQGGLRESRPTSQHQRPGNRTGDTLKAPQNFQTFFLPCSPFPKDTPQAHFSLHTPKADRSLAVSLTSSDQVSRLKKSSDTTAVQYREIGVVALWRLCVGHFRVRRVPDVPVG